MYSTVHLKIPGLKKWKMRKMNTEARKCLNLLGNVSYHSMLKMRKSLRNKFISEKVCVQSWFKMENNRLIIKERIK